VGIVEASDIVKDFFIKRAELLEQIARRQADVDSWMTEHGTFTIDTVPATDMAELLARVFLSRDALQELANLDASVIQMLHQIRPPEI
jgi:hypothetical protein